MPCKILVPKKFLLAGNFLAFAMARNGFTVEGLRQGHPHPKNHQNTKSARPYAEQKHIREREILHHQKPHKGAKSRG